MRVRLLAAFVLALLLASCGGGGGGGGDAPPVASPAGSVVAPSGEDEPTAGLWITRNEGSDVLLETDVPAGLTVLQALDRVAEVETRYGGRFVQSIDGIEGSLNGQEDWFFFVNGVEPDVGAAELRLAAGDVAWWDFRSWSDRMAAPVVVGAFPEPFLHGFDGRRRPAEVQAPAELSEAAAAVEAVLGDAGGEGEPNVFVLEPKAEADGATLRAERGAQNDSPVRFVLSGSLEAVRAAALTLAQDPASVRFRYEVRFDALGRVLG